jgi:hypothetical protein
MSIVAALYIDGERSPYYGFGTDGSVTDGSVYTTAARRACGCSRRGPCASPTFGMPLVDCWPRSRDARTYRGPWLAGGSPSGMQAVFYALVYP